MSLLSWILRKELNKLITDQSLGSEFIDKILQNYKNNPIYMKDDVSTYVNEGYLFNPIVYSIVSFIAQKAAAIPWGVYEVKSEKALNLYKSATPGLEQYKKDIVKVKALAQIESHQLNDLFDRPNSLQSWSELTEQEIGFKLITGNAFTHVLGPEGGNNAGQIKEMWSLPSQVVTIVAGDKYEPIKHYELLGDRSLVIPKEQIIHQKYWTPEYIAGRWLYGISPLQAARRVITRSNSSYDATVASFQNMGAYGMITGNSADLDGGFTPEIAEKVQKDLKKKSGPKSSGSKLVTPYNLKWQQFGMSPVDLNITESEKMDLRTMCMIFHVPSELFGDAAVKTYANTKEAGSAVYTNAVIPSLTQKRDVLNAYIKPRYKENIFVDFDVSMISELQEDLTALTAALSQVWYLTGNEKRDMISFGIDEAEPLMNEYLIPAGLYPLSGFNDVDDIAIEEAAKQLNLTDYGKGTI